MRFRTLAPGKINLCLYLGPPREDGRHELVTLFQPVSLADEVTLAVEVGSGADVVVCPGVEGQNLAARALEELRARGWDAPPVRLEIVKRIPVAGGMAGGSADAGATLRLAAAAHAVPRSGLESEVAAVLGADVPSQLYPQPVVGVGAGDELLAVPGGQSADLAVLILPAGEHLSTGAVFAEADRLGLARSTEELAALRTRVTSALVPERDFPVALIPERDFPVELMVNDLEPAALSLCPSIAGALSLARELGADHALLCGSGPTVAGVFLGADGPARAAAAAAAAGDRDVPAVAATPVDAGFAAVHGD